MSSLPGWDPQLPRVGNELPPTTEDLSCVLDKYNDFIEANRIEDSRERMKTLRKLVRNEALSGRRGSWVPFSQRLQRSLSLPIVSVSHLCQGREREGGF